MKVALVYSFSDSDWFSCTVILKNLLKSYTELYGAKNLIHIDYGEKRFVDLQDIKKFDNPELKKVIFLNHKPTPINFLKRLEILDGEKISSEREYIIHIFGDFPLYLQEWRSVFEILENKETKIICASDAQKELIQSLLIQDDVVFKCPFPVDTNDFYTDNDLRKKTRKELNIASDEKIFIFTGRLSYQKRIVKMIEAFYSAIDSKAIPETSKLLLVGPFDNLGILYLGVTKVRGEYFRSVDREINKRPDLANKIILFSEVKHERLNGLYNAADCFLSLGTYHDEDYGMSIAEAVCSGLPTILTNWAGYKSFKFKESPENCELIPVRLTNRMPEIDMKCIDQAFTNIAGLTSSKEERSIIGKIELSVENCAKKLETIMDIKVNNFEGRSKLLIRLTNENIKTDLAMFRKEREVIYNDLYFEVYNVYAK